MKLRPALTLLHRWFGLAAAGFLFVAGLTGAVIAWDHELDAWLNPGWFEAQTPGTPQAPLALARQYEAVHPQEQVRYMPLSLEDGETLSLYVQPRLQADGSYGAPLAHDHVVLDPVTGQVLGARQWGAISLAPEHLIPFLYKLHYTLHLPDMGGVAWGIWLMGIVAIGWTIDGFVALWLAFPSAKAWRKSLAFRWHKGGYALNFDLHRSGGVWLWVLLTTLAITAVTMNLKEQVMRPLVSVFSTLTPSPMAGRTALNAADMQRGVLSREQAIAQAQSYAQQQGWTAPVGGVFLSNETGLYGVGFHQAGQGHGDGGLGPPWVYVDIRSGRIVGAEVPGQGSAGDLFLQAQFPLHSGRILGLTGRIIVTVLGLAVAVLCVTGVVIWARKRRARQHAMRPMFKPAA